MRVNFPVLQVALHPESFEPKAFAAVAGISRVKAPFCAQPLAISCARFSDSRSFLGQHGFGLAKKGEEDDIPITPFGWGPFGTRTPPPPSAIIPPSKLPRGEKKDPNGGLIPLRIGIDDELKRKRWEEKNRPKRDGDGSPSSEGTEIVNSNKIDYSV